MSNAAQAKAAKEQAAVARAVAAAELARPAPKPAIKRAPAPMPDVPSPVGRQSPAVQRKAFLIARTAGGILAASGIALDLSGSNDNRELETEAARILMRLAEDQRGLKQIQSIERKIARKRELLPAYEAWCAGVLAGGAGQRGPLDEVFTTMMAWRIDVGDFMEAMPMVEHAAVYGLEMPERFDRGVVAFSVEQISEAAIAAYDKPVEGATPFPAAVLTQLQDLVELLDADLHDEIHAKLHRALGLAVLAGVTPDDYEDLRERQAQALRCYTRAFELNAKVGVKKQIDALTKALKPASPPADAGQSDTPPAEGS